jgi:hypothetical protein
MKMSERGQAVFGRAILNRQNGALDDAVEFLPRIAAASHRL